VVVSVADRLLHKKAEVREIPARGRRKRHFMVGDRKSVDERLKIVLSREFMRT
jgi:hypothetical protein